MRLVEFGPSGTLTHTLPASAVFYLDWAANASSLWASKSPLDWTPLSSRLAANAERSLGDELNSVTARPIGFPPGIGASGGDSDVKPVTNPVDALMADIAAADGSPVAVEGTVGHQSGTV